MIKNYLKIAFRNLMKYKFISFINLFGLTVGLACCLLILTYILNELSYDKYHHKADRIYRVTRSWTGPTGDVSLHLGTIAPIFGYYFINEFPDIEKMTRLLQNGNTTIRYEDKILIEEDGYFADENFFSVFDVPVLKGNREKALNDPYSIMLTEDVAKKYFGNTDPINKILRLNNQLDCKVTGIFEKLPANSHIHPQLLISFNTLKDTAVYGEERLRTSYSNNSFFTYLLFPAGYNIKRMESQFPHFIDPVMPTSGTASKVSAGTQLHLQKLTDIHLRSHLDSEAEENGDIKRVYIFSAIALFILLIACINYMNLSTARSALRAREIGVRKVVGAQKGELIAQFLSESVLISCVATLIAILLNWLVLPWLNKLSGQEMNPGILVKWQVIMVLFLVPFLVGIVSGIYPALFMSSFKPVRVLKGLFKAGGGNISFRKVLVVAQFSVSIILIISTVIVFQQLKYIQQKSLGFNKEHIITLRYNSALNNTFDAFRAELLQHTSIKDVGRSSRIPTARLLDAMDSYTQVGDSMQPSQLDIKFVNADYHFVTAYGIRIVAGRNFSREYSTDTAGFILNESAVKAIGWKSPAQAVGKPFKYGPTSGRIIGVIGNFHFESMHEKIVPLVLVLPPLSQPSFSRISVKVAGSGITAALSQIEKTWRRFLPEVPYQYNFLDENYARLYQAEQRQGTIFTVFACIAILIASLGLFGLSAFAISQRIREIGIRKVLGAGTGNIVGLFSKDFLKLVIIAALIAFPIAWYAMSNWLQDFAYRINIPWWAFVLAGIIAAAIAFVTTSLLAVKAAVSNPVKSLRAE